MILPTVKVKTETGFKIINESDLTDKDIIYTEPKQKKKSSKAKT